MELATQLTKPALEILSGDRQLARQSEKREVVAVAAERQDAAAVRAEVFVNRRAGATGAAFQRRLGTNGNRIGHAPKELPQPQVCFAFGL